MEVSFTGYVTHRDEILVISGKESVLEVALAPSSLILDEVVVGGTGLTRLVPGLESANIEKAIRIPANFFDPVRMLTSYPAVVAASDQANFVVVRGNSPNGLLWRLNGLDIVSPNHLSNAGTLSDKPMANGGGVNILSAQMLDRTNFFSGALPVAYGNALAGVFDMSLRPGNTERREYTIQASLLGIDLSAEGPLTKDHSSSFLANYRYSTVGLLSKLGVQFGDEDISFQDFGFNLNHSTKQGASVSLFGFYGSSANDFNAKPMAEWEEDKDQYNINYGGDTYALGVSYRKPVGPGVLTSGAAYSSSGQDREAIDSQADVNQVKLLQDVYHSFKSLASASVRYQMALGERHKGEIGLMANYQTDDLNYIYSVGCGTCGPSADSILTGTGNTWLLQPHVNFSMRLSGTTKLDVGLRYVYHTYSRSGSAEPRILLVQEVSPGSALTFSYGIVSRQQLPQVYFAPGNDRLGLTRAHHFDVDYRKSWANGLEFSSGIFYQRIFNVPVEEGSSSTFSAINLLEEMAPANLVNMGTGENMGVTATAEKSFFGSDYFILAGSLYRSVYTPADGRSYDSRFNGRFTLNATYGREWARKKKNSVFGLNTRLLYLGGLRESAVDVAASQAEKITVYDQSSPYSQSLQPYFRIDLRISSRRNKPGYTRTLALDIQNLLNRENDSYQYYDFVQQQVVRKRQLGIIPVLVYRVDF
jgi:hypothetical protein